MVVKAEKQGQCQLNTLLYDKAAQFEYCLLMLAGLIKELLLNAVLTGMPVILRLARCVFDNVFKIDIRLFSGQHVSTKECINM